MTPEGKELANVTKWLKANNLVYIRMALQPQVATGWPDLLILLPGGSPLFLEMKAPGKKPTPLQSTRLEALDGLGYLAEWADNADDAIRVIKNALYLLSRRANPEAAA